MGESTAAVRQDIERTRAEMGQTIDAIADRTSPARMMDRQRRRATDRVRAVRDTVMGTAESARGVVTGASQEGAGSAQDTTSNMADTVRRAPHMVEGQTRGNPLAAGLIAFGSGLLVASILPSSRPERQATAKLKEEAEPAIQQVKEAGQQVVQDLKGTAQEAGAEVKDTATQSAQQFAVEAKGSAQQVTEQTKAAGQDVVGQAREAAGGAGDGDPMAGGL